jgi:hypothetical protein
VQCLERALHQCLKRKITSKNLYNAKFSNVCWSNARLLVKCATVSKKQSACARLWGIVPARSREEAGSLDSAVNRLIDRSAKAGLNPCKSKTIIGKLNEPN